MHSHLEETLIKVYHLDKYYSVVFNTWNEICHTKLPGPAHAKLREMLLELEDIHGNEVRKRFPTGIRSLF